MSYLDYNSTAPVLPEVAAAISGALDLFGNPSSVHAEGRKARAAIEEARDHVAAAVAARAENVIFTSGASEANAMALAVGDKPVWATSIEHPSVLAHAPDTHRLPATTDGVVDLHAAAAMIDKAQAPAIVAVMLVNNETGVIQPVRAIADMVHARGGWLHCDAVQALGRLPIDLETLGADTVAISAHKIGGPKGVGALIISPRAQFMPRVIGGGQERGRRAGTENTLGIVGFGAAAKAVSKQIADQSRIKALRDDLERWIAASVPDAVVHGARAARVANTTNVSAPGAASEIQIIALDLAGVAVSAGAACSSGRVAESHVLTAMGVPQHQVRSAIRISLGAATTAADIDAFRRAWSPARDRRAA